MKDKFGREINYLRISVTQKCNLKCKYCGYDTPDIKELTCENIIKIVRIFASLGIEKVRLTGGEPLLRKDIIDIACGIKKIEGIKKLAITTNGIFLAEMAEKLKLSGVDIINISLDTTDQKQYTEITGLDSIKEVTEGIKKAVEVGFESVKINSVLMPGINDNQIDSLIDIAKYNNIDVRFIELMPFGDDKYDKNSVIKGTDILKNYHSLRKIEPEKYNSAAVYYVADDFKGRIGLISPLSNKFCSQCNRIRLLADGCIKPCLGDNKSIDIMKYINDEKKLKEEIINAIKNKPEGHHFESRNNFQAMNKIGG